MFRCYSKNEIDFCKTTRIPFPIVPFIIPSVDVTSGDVLRFNLNLNQTFQRISILPS